jgi:hypothetical protein
MGDVLVDLLVPMRGKMADPVPPVGAAHRLALLAWMQQQIALVTGWMAAPESVRLADLGLDLAAVLTLVAEAERVGAGHPDDLAVYDAATVGELVDAIEAATPPAPRALPWREDPDVQETP